MTEEFLVFRGHLVTYSSIKQRIECIGDDDCFTITNVPLEKVILDTFWAAGIEKRQVIAFGDELWSDGTHYIIKETKPPKKHQTKQTQTPNQQLKNLSTYVDEAAGNP